jgi:hydroxymethylglutaryl-CoA lyase
MSGRHPEIVYTEEGMRAGMQIEDANIPVDAKVALLDALSETGLKRIVVGSFVSPRYTPQMVRIDELMQKFHPKEGVTYTALALNEQGVEQGLPPFEVDGDWPWNETFFPKPSAITHQDGQ